MCFEPGKACKLSSSQSYPFMWVGSAHNLMNVLPDWKGEKSLVWQKLWKFIWFELNSDNNNSWLGGVWKESLKFSSETFLSLTLNKSYDWVLSEEEKV